MLFYRASSSTVERRTHNPSVAGSNPAGPTKNFSVVRLENFIKVKAIKPLIFHFTNIQKVKAFPIDLVVYTN